jgi:hypothetical protein
LTISGRALIALPERKGWQILRRSNHGVFLSRHFPGESRPRTTVIPGKTRDLKPGVQGRILSHKQKGLGRAELERMMSE